MMLIYKFEEIDNIFYYSSGIQNKAKIFYA